MLLSLSACGSKTGTGNGDIPTIKEQLRRDSLALLSLQQQYQAPLQEHFRWCDSMLAFVPKEHVNDYFGTLNLAQAYISQFNEMLPVMQHDVTYIGRQLDLLQNDIDTHFVSDSLANEYLNDEKASADTLHNRVLYFQDRLAQQDQALRNLKKKIGKAASK